MASHSIVIPGTEQPVRPPKVAQLARIQARVAASEAVVNLLCELAFGPRPEAGWHGPRPAYAEAV